MFFKKNYLSVVFISQVFVEFDFILGSTSNRRLFLKNALFLKNQTYNLS